MNYIHYTKDFESKIQENSKRDLVYRKLEELSAADKPESLNSVDPYAKGILVLKFNKANLCRIIIQHERIEIDGVQLHVLFVRDYIPKKGFDYFWGSVTYPQLSSGDWLVNNPLPTDEVDRFKFKYLSERKNNQSIRPSLPENLTKWLENFQIKLSFDIYEREDWVNYSNDDSTTGLAEKYLILFRDTLKAILNSEDSHNGPTNVKIEPIDQSAFVFKAINEPFQVGIIFSDFADVDGKRIILLHDGAHVIQQKNHWDKALKKVEEETAPVEANILSISRDAFRAYPKWIVQSENDDLWISIEKYHGSNNLSLLPEQVGFLSKFKFPAYINGQAGSGKSTMLYYLFANVFFYKCANELEGDVIFLTENDTLLENTSKAILGLVSSNPEFNLGLTIEQRDNIRQHFASFKNFLLSILPEEFRKDYDVTKYLSFSIFKEFYNSKLHNKKYSAEEVWFVISTYVYGYYEDRTIETVESYEDDTNGIPSKFRIISSDRFKGIVEQALPFYKKLIDEGWWDKITLVRSIWQHYSNALPAQYTVVFCDEAQDFTRIELRLILRASRYTKYDLSNATQIPIVLAGDALQTVSPTGFSDIRLHQMYYEVFTEANFLYDKKSATYNPQFNYRSVQEIVRLANVVQNFRKESLKEEISIKQEAKRADHNNVHLPILHFTEWLSSPSILETFIKKFKYKSFIVPVDLNEESDYVNSDTLLNNGFTDVKSSIDAKGAEYSQVVVYGFGDQYIREFGPLKWQRNTIDFKTKFFFNKLYVAITRAQNELIIIDSKKACEEFWKPLLEIPNSVANKWETYQDINDIVLIDPQTGLATVKDSTPEDALNNATIDMQQGINDRNGARLIVASNVFLMLGKLDDANTCLGHREAIARRWSSAGSHFIKAKKFEEAADAFFQGKEWLALDGQTKALQGAKQEARLLVARLMQNETWEKEELSKVYALRSVLMEVMYKIDWYSEYSNTIKNYSEHVTSPENKRELAFVLESIVIDSDLSLWEIIGRLYFDTKQFNSAIDAWDKILGSQKTPDYFPEYIIAHIEKAKDERNLHDELLWCGRIFDTKAPIDKKISNASRISEIYESEPAIANTSPVKLELWEHIYHSLIILGEQSKLNQVAITFENLSFNPNQLENLYGKFLKDCGIEEISVLLKERWVKAKAKVLGYAMTNRDDKLIQKINEDFKNQNFPFKDSNMPWSFEEMKEISEIPKSISSSPDTHFRNLVLQNFRSFENINIPDIGQFNLILGDNNTGKTTLLEALLFSPNPNECLINFLYAKRQRNSNAIGEKDYLLLKKLISKNSTANYLKIILKNGRRIWSFIIRRPTVQELHKKLDLEGLDTRQYLAIETNDKEVVISESLDVLARDLEVPHIFKNIPLVPFGKGYTEKLSSVYQSEIGSKRANISPFIEQMKTFIPGLVHITFEPEDQTIKIVEEIDGKDYESSLSDFGEGANKLFRIMIQLHAAKGGRLMIDEIDAGIHYSRFTQFWKIILKTAKDYNVQVFATTHNDECIKHFAELLQEEDFIPYRNISRIITLDRHIKTKEIVPIVRDFDSIAYSSQNEIEIRGNR